MNFFVQLFMQHGLPPIAEVHASPWATIPLGVLAAAWAAWYWRQLGERAYPESRRRIRRASILVMLFAIVLLVRAASFLDPETEPSGYTVGWAMSILFILVLILLATIDAVNNMRIHRRDRARMLDESRNRLREASHEARRRRARGSQER